MNKKCSNMKKFLLLLTPFFLFACSNADMYDSEGVSMSKKSNSLNQNVQLSVKQAEAYANLFSKGFDTNDISEEDKSKTRAIASTNEGRTIHDVNYIIEGGGTLLYAVNYDNDKGFVILSGANNAFPVVAHSSVGNVNLNEISPDNPLSLTIEAYKERAKDALNDTTAIYSTYFDEWKDLGKDGYEYEVELSDDEPKPESSQTRSSRRKDSSGKKSIYPYTGKDLNYWCQEGGYNFYAKNKYPIGCPAIATGMLMYDTSQRILGNSQSTYPSFSYTDKSDLKDITTGTELAKKLRQIADSIPGYNFGKNGSGATPGNILIGLHKLGYKKAQLVQYDFEKLYENLQFKGIDYFGKETTFNRGVLILAYEKNGTGGHIWFCDGYYEQSYTVTKKFIGIKVKSWKEYDDRLYMNWGWGTDGGNGWYSATDNDVWSSLDTKKYYYLKSLPQMFINLSYYEYPQNAY